MCIYINFINRDREKDKKENSQIKWNSFYKFLLKYIFFCKYGHRKVIFFANNYEDIHEQKYIHDTNRTAYQKMKQMRVYRKREEFHIYIWMIEYYSPQKYCIF